MRALAVLLVLLLVAPPAQAATPPGVRTIDERIGQVDEALARANETHGENEALQAARVELSRSGVALTRGATVIAGTNLLKAYAALEMGRTRAQAQGSEDPEQALIDRAQHLARRADANVSSLRSDLASASQAGLDPAAFDGLLAVGEHVVQAMNMLDQHRIHQRTWDQGHHEEEVLRGLVSTAASAAMAVDLASDLQAATAQARAEAPVGQVVAPEALAEISQDRVAWAEQQGSTPNQEARQRMLSFHHGGEHLLALAAFTLWHQDLTFNRISTDAQRGKDIQPSGIAEEQLAEARSPLEAWHERFGTVSGSAPGALASARFTLDRSPSDRSEAANRSGAFAASLVDRGVEHTGMLVEAFTGVAHVPGQALVAPNGTSQAEADRAVPGPVLVAVGALLFGAVLAGLGWRRR